MKTRYIFWKVGQVMTLVLLALVVVSWPGQSEHPVLAQGNGGSDVGRRTGDEKPGPFLEWPLPDSIPLTEILRFPDTRWTHNLLGIKEDKHCPPYPALLYPGVWTVDGQTGDYPGHREEYLKESGSNDQARWFNEDNSGQFHNAFACYGGSDEPGLPEHDHAGTDIAAPEGTEVRAAADADQMIIENGNRITLRHRNVNGSGQDWYTVYVHVSPLDENGIYEQAVEANQLIGTTNSLDHLHFQVARSSDYSHASARNLWGIDEAPWDGCLWIDQELCQTLQSTSDYEVVAKNGPAGPVNPGAQFTVSFTLRNTSSETWTRGIVRLGTDDPRDHHSPFYRNEAAGWFRPNRIRLQEATVPPGDTGAFEALFTAPQAPGRYERNFGVVVEGVRWLESDDQASIAVEVNDVCEAGGQTIFCDVPAGHLFQEYIESIYDKGITNGCRTTATGNKYFCPDEHPTRNQMAKLVANAMRVAVGETPLDNGTCLDEPAPPFSDVTADSQFCRHIKYLQERQVIGGTGGEFKPDDFTTREQAAKFVANGMFVVLGQAPIADGTCINEAPLFPDVGADNKFCRHINYLRNNDFIGGFSDGTYRPGRFITRAETAKLVDQFPIPPTLPETAIRVNPANLRLSAGETGATTVQVDFAKNLYAVQFSLSFDPAIVQVVDVDPNNAGVQIAVGDLFARMNHFVAVNRVDNAAGKIEFSATLRDPALPLNGSGSLAEITWRAVAQGNSEVSFTEAKLSNPEGFAVGHRQENGLITVKGVKGMSEGTVLLQGRTDHSGSDVFLLEENCDQAPYFPVAAANTPGVPHAVTDDKGNFKINPIPGYTYGCLQVFHHGYLVGRSETFGQLGTITLLGGDVTQDDLIDIFDLAYGT